MASSPARSVATDFLLRFVGVQLVALVVAVVLVLSGYSVVARQYVRSQAIQFMDVMLSVREYTSRKVNPIIAPINAVSPNKETDTPNPSLAAASLAYNFGCVAYSTRDVRNNGGGEGGEGGGEGGGGDGALNMYTDPELDLLLSSSPIAPINAVSPYKETEIPN